MMGLCGTGGVIVVEPPTTTRGDGIAVGARRPDTSCPPQVSRIEPPMRSTGMTACGFPGGLGCPKSDGRTAGRGGPQRPGRLAVVGPARIHRAGHPGDDAVDELGEVGAEPRGGAMSVNSPMG